MKIVIDISKNEYNDIIEQVKKCDYPDMGLGKIIANGKPYEERPKGEWIKVEEGYSYHYECNICHERPLKSRYIREEEFSNFCPNCGAKMGGEHND